MPAAAARKAVVMRSSALGTYDEVLAGFTRWIKEHQPALAVREVPLPSADQAAAAIKTIRGAKPDFILTLGSVASRFAKENLGDIPIVFCAVLNPLEVKLDAAGVTIDVNPGDQIKYIRANFPSLQRIGVLHNPGQASFVVNEFKKIKGAGDKRLFLEPVRSVSDLDKAITRLARKADCLLLVADPAILPPQAMPQVILKTLGLRLPIFTSSLPLVKAGALGGLYADPAATGFQAGQIAAQLLAGKERASIRVQWPARTKSALNLPLAERLGLRVDPRLIQKTDSVFR